MINFLRQRFGELAITGISFFLSFLLFKAVTDDYGSLGCNFAAGQFSDYPYIYPYYLMLIGMAGIYRFFYDSLPAYNWMGISFIVFDFLALYLSLRAIKNFILKDNKCAYLLRITQVLFSLFFIENITSITHTRSSILLCGIGLFNLAFNQGINRKEILLNSAIFILGMLIRPESSFGMLLLVSTGYLVFCFNVKHLIKKFFLPALATVALFSYFTVDWIYTDIYVKKIEPEIEYKIMDRRTLDISEMGTAEDSVKYEAAMVGMWFDLKTMTPDFLRSLLKPGINHTPEHAVSVFFHVASFYKHYFFIPCLFLAFIFLSCFLPGSPKKLLRILIFQLTTFFIIYAVDFNGKLVTERHFLNIQLISLLITSFYFFNPAVSIDFWKQHKSLSVGCLLLVLFGTGKTIISYKEHNDWVAREINCYEPAMKEIENAYSNRLIVVTLSNLYLFDHNFSILNQNYKKNTYLIFDAFTFSLVPDYMNYLRQKCNCDPTDPVAFYQWLSDSKALYMAEPARYDLTERYMNTVHHQNIKFTLPDNFRKPGCIEDTEMKDYEIRKVFAENL